MGDWADEQARGIIWLDVCYGNILGCIQTALTQRIAAALREAEAREAERIAAFVDRWARCNGPDVLDIKPRDLADAIRASALTSEPAGR